MEMMSQCKKMKAEKKCSISQRQDMKVYNLLLRSTNPSVSRYLFSKHSLLTYMTHSLGMKKVETMVEGTCSHRGL